MKNEADEASAQITEKADVKLAAVKDDDVEMSDFSLLSDDAAESSKSGEKQDAPPPHIANIIKKKRIAKLDLKQYRRDCRRDEELLQQNAKGRSGIANYDTFCQCF